MIGDSRAYVALGLQGQHVCVDPAVRTVVAKLSYYPPGDPTALHEETAAFLSAVSA